MTIGFAIFETAVGSCGIAWSERGIAGIQLPEGDRGETRAKIAARWVGAKEKRPTAEVKRAIAAIAALLAGGQADLSAIVLDLEGLPPFHREVYRAARQIGPGLTRTYGELAQELGSPGSSRAVGQALGRNPFPIVVPCHRVLASGGKIGGFSAYGGADTKRRLLGIERASGAGALPLFAPRPIGFDLEAATRHLRAADPALGKVIEAVGPCRLKIDRTNSLFAALAEAIVYQQLHAKAASTIFARVKALFPGAESGLRPEHINDGDEVALRGAGLSGAKLRALKDLAERSLNGELPSLDAAQAMDDEAIIERLIVVRGIGRWTAEMLLMFRLGRPDVLPVADYGIKKGFMVAFKKRAMPEPDALLKRGEKWRPYRSAASWYLWRAAEMAKE